MSKEILIKIERGIGINIKKTYDILDIIKTIHDSINYQSSEMDCDFHFASAIEALISIVDNLIVAEEAVEKDIIQLEINKNFI